MSSLMKEILNMLRKIIVHTTIHIVATGCNSHSQDRFVLLPDRKKQILWRWVTTLPNAYEVNKRQGQGSDFFNQRPKHTPVSWKPAANNKHKQHKQCAYEFFFYQPSSPMNFVAISGATVGKDVVIHWCWGGDIALSVCGALRGEDNGRQVFSWWYMMCK